MSKSEAIYLEKNQVPKQLLGEYSGQKFRVVIANSVTLSNTYWSGGTRSYYYSVDLVTGKRAMIAADSTAPQFGPCADGESIAIKQGYAIIEHSYFCGKDMGLVFYIRSENAAKLLPEKIEGLTDCELCLLDATAGLKSSYAGRKPRIEMMHANGFNDDQIHDARQSLIEKKLLRKNGSITVAGRNQRPPRDKFRQW